MYISEYKYKHGTEQRPGYIAIPELERKLPSVNQFIELANLNITLTKPTAFIFVPGYTISGSEGGIGFTSKNPYVPAIKLGSSYALHQWVHTFKGKHNLRHASMATGTCAAGIEAIKKAQDLLNYEDIEEVIIIGQERITSDTVRLFSELRIPVTCGDGFFYMKLSNEPEGYAVINPQWKYAYNQNPFMFTRSDLDNVMPDYPVAVVKLHGTGTQSNTEAEAGLASIAPTVQYKHLIGHTQGISSLLETCMVLADDNLQGVILITANGLGGFYGAFTLIK